MAAHQLSYAASAAEADFEDAEDSRPLAAALDIGGYGSSTPYSIPVNAIVAKHTEDVRAKTLSILNLPADWKKKLRHFINSKNTELLDFLKVDVPSHPVMGPVEVLLRRFGNPRVTSSHPSVRDFVFDISGADYIAELNASLEEVRGSETGIKAHLLCTQYLYDQYKNAGEAIIRQQTALKNKLDKLDNIQKGLLGVFAIDPNTKYEPLMQATEEYLKMVFEDNRIADDYSELIEAYRKFIALKDVVHMLRASNSSENEPLCCICLTNTVTYVLSPCGHTFCEGCVRRQSNQCPICRATMRDRIRMYFS